MFDRLQLVVDRYDKLTELLCDPNVASDSTKLRDYSKEQSDIQETVESYNLYKQLTAQLSDAKAMLGEKLDDEMREMVKMEVDELSEQLATLEEKLRILMLPKDPNDDKNVMVEIRGAAGGDEAALFAYELYRMYCKYADSQGWKVELLDYTENDVGGFKEVSFMVNGRGAYSKLKFESGAHRVQRVPATESQGRIHTSTSTVVVMPEAEDLEVEILDKDIRIDTFCSSGAGGQSVNTTKSAVRVLHVPTGIMATCQDGKSQNENKLKALQVLRTRIVDIKRQEEEAKYAGERKSKVGTGDRSERIRTYNFPQSRVTDHRINLTVHRLDAIMNGDIDDIVDALTITAQTELMEQESALS